MRRVVQLVLCCIGAAVMVAAATSARAQSLTVAADSSLGEAMKVLIRDFETSHKGVGVKLLVGASGALLEQLAQDTPADVLACADAQTVELGVQRRLLVPDLRGDFASNTLVLVVPAATGSTVQRLSDLAQPQVLRIAMGREASVPSGRYARQAIDAQRLWPSLQRKVLIASDVGEIVALVARGEVEAGFVFASDAAASNGSVRVVESLPTTAPIRHVANVVADSRNPGLAREFVAYLRSEAAGVVFRRFGFGGP